jgi:hypothetical protein
MVNVEFDKKLLRLDDLIEGKVFGESELIIERDLEGMTTIRHEEGLGEHNKEYDIKTFYYDIKANDQEIISINNNGYDEIFIEEAIHNEYQMKLKEKGLW